MQLTCSFWQLTCRLLFFVIVSDIILAEVRDMPEIIEVNNLVKYYKEIKAVDDISFTVNEGELFAFLGENGAGKSTSINVLCTVLSKTEGKVTIDGVDLDKGEKEIRNKIGSKTKLNVKGFILWYVKKRGKRKN